MKNISDKSCRENQNTHLIFNNFFVVYEIIWKNIVEPDRLQMAIRHMRIICWIPRATNKYSGCVIFSAFLLQQWLHEGASLLRYTCIACIVITGTVSQAIAVSTVTEL
jgi:hypothetical protein